MVIVDDLIATQEHFISSQKSTMIDGFPSHISELITKMEFVGAVPPNKKICFKWKNYLPIESWLTQPLRWYVREDADFFCEQIQKILDSLLQILSEKKTQEDEIVRSALINASAHFRQGISNSLQTYEKCNNPCAVSRLQTILVIISLKIPEINTS